jgi:hypothetical protein
MEKAMDGGQRPPLKARHARLGKNTASAIDPMGADIDCHDDIAFSVKDNSQGPLRSALRKLCERNGRTACEFCASASEDQKGCV